MIEITRCFLMNVSHEPPDYYRGIIVHHLLSLTEEAMGMGWLRFVTSIERDLPEDWAVKITIRVRKVE